MKTTRLGVPKNPVKTPHTRLRHILVFRHKPGNDFVFHFHLFSRTTPWIRKNRGWGLTAAAWAPPDDTWLPPPLGPRPLRPSASLHQIRRLFFLLRKKRYKRYRRGTCPHATNMTHQPMSCPIKLYC